MNYQKARKIKKLYFGYQEIARALKVSFDSAKVSATRLVRQEALVRVKRNVYVLRERWGSLGKEEEFILANLIQVPSYISLMTALEYYQLTTHIQRDFFESVAVKRTKEIKVQGAVFNYTKIKGDLYFGFSRINGFFIASPEKAFLDALYLKSLRRYDFDITSVDFNKLNIKKARFMAKKFPPATQKLLKKIWKS